MAVLDEIAAERQRRIDAADSAADHDDSQVGGELADAAISYAIVACVQMPDEIRDTHFKVEPPILWPWGREFWKPKDRRSDLITAATLLLAEVERLDRRSDARSSRCDWSGATIAAG